MVKHERTHVGMPGQNCMHTAPQVASPFSVNDPQLENTTVTTSSYVIGDQIFDVAGIKSVQIQDAIDWKLNGLIHQVRRWRTAVEMSGTNPETAIGWRFAQEQEFQKLWPLRQSGVNILHFWGIHLRGIARHPP
jgi:hypothetical protein